MSINKIAKLLTILLLSITFTSCKSNDETPKTGEKKRLEPNVRKKINQSDSGIFTSSKKNENLLGVNNPMWKATLSVLDFTPLTTASYNGGIIVTDWYTMAGSKESIKISVTFLSNEISANSIEVKSYKKICTTNLDCSTAKMDQSFDFAIKQKILKEVPKFEKINKK